VLPHAIANRLAELLHQIAALASIPPSAAFWLPRRDAIAVALGNFQCSPSPFVVKPEGSWVAAEILQIERP
jgi:hypothetical protein